MWKERISGLELELAEELKDSPYLAVEFLDGQGAGLFKSRSHLYEMWKKQNGRA